MERFKDFHNEKSSDPLYRQVAEYLRGLIVRGELACGERLPSEQMLSEQLAVSRLTLRKGLSILIAQNLIFQVPHHGTFVAQKQQRHLRIGVLWRPKDHGAESSYVSSLLLSICRKGAEYDNTEIVFLNPKDQDPQKIADYVANSRCDGVIVPVGTTEFAEILADPKFDSLPVCYINCISAKLNGLRYNVVLGDDAILTGLTCLMEKGHRRIAYVSQKSSGGFLNSRNSSFLKYAPPEAIPMIVDSRDCWFDLSRRAACELCRLPEPPTAVLTPGVLFSSGVWHGLTDCGKRVPADISLLGFDCMEDAFPFMSTIDQPLEEMASRALSIVRDCALGKVYRTHLCLFNSFISDRGSIAKLQF